MKLKLIIPLMALLVFAGCKKATYLESDVKDLTVAIAGQSDTIVLHSDVNDFKLDSAPEWAKSELKDSVLVVTVGKNDSNGERKGVIVVSNGDLKLNIPVLQQFKATHLELPSGNEVKIGKEGGTQTLAVDCDGNVTVEGAEGFEAKCAGGKLTVTAPKNDGAPIKKTIKLVADEFSQEVTVEIAGTICPTCKGTGTVKCKSCGGEGSKFTMEPAPGLYGCRACGGKGYSCRASDAGYRNGSGKQPCPTCKGKK